jgi:hypothetical protein
MSERDLSEDDMGEGDMSERDLSERDLSERDPGPTLLGGFRSSACRMHATPAAAPAVAPAAAPVDATALFEGGSMLAALWVGQVRAVNEGCERRLDSRWLGSEPDEERVS